LVSRSVLNLTKVHHWYLALTSFCFILRHTDGVIIETTGLADPAPVVQTFFIDDAVKKWYNLDSVITVTDANVILDRLAEEKP